MAAAVVFLSWAHFFLSLHHLCVVEHILRAEIGAVKQQVPKVHFFVTSGLFSLLAFPGAREASILLICTFNLINKGSLQNEGFQQNQWLSFALTPGG